MCSEPSSQIRPRFELDPGGSWDDSISLHSAWDERGIDPRFQGGEPLAEMDGQSKQTDRHQIPPCIFYRLGMVKDLG
jgi:hypothetical protein